MQKGMDGMGAAVFCGLFDGRSARTKTNEQVRFDAKPASYRALQNEAICSLIKTEEPARRWHFGKWGVTIDWL